MTLPYSISKSVFLGNGVTTQFPLNFRVWDAGQLDVRLVDPHGVETVATGWSVALPTSQDAGGGILTYLHQGAPLPMGWKLAVLRNMPFTQGVNLITGTRFDPQVIEDALDSATAERQQLLEGLSRSIKVSIFSNVKPEELLQSLFDARDTAQTSASDAGQSAVLAASKALDAKASADTAKQAALSVAMIGKIDMLPFRATELPFGWYVCDGRRYLTSTPQGAALKALSANYKADWGITLEGSGASETINVPTLFHEDGRGCLIRAVDGVTRQVGSMQQDALQNITGVIGNVCSAHADGAFYSLGTSTGYYAQAGTFTKAAMDASRVVRTDTETRPLNIGMTPAIFVGA